MRVCSHWFCLSSHHCSSHILPNPSLLRTTRGERSPPDLCAASLFISPTYIISKYQDLRGTNKMKMISRAGETKSRPWLMTNLFDLRFGCRFAQNFGGHISSSGRDSGYLHCSKSSVLVHFRLRVWLLCTILSKSPYCLMYVC